MQDEVYNVEEKSKVGKKQNISQGNMATLSQVIAAAY